MFEIIYELSREFILKHPEGDYEQIWNHIEKILKTYDDLETDWNGVIIENGEYDRLYQKASNLPIYYIFRDGSVYHNKINEFIVSLFEIPSNNLTPKKLGEVAFHLGILENQKENMSLIQKKIFSIFEKDNVDDSRLFADHNNLKKIEIDPEDVKNIKKILKIKV